MNLRIMVFPSMALTLAALLLTVFPASVAAGNYLSEADILATFEGTKVTALVKKRGDVTARMGGRAGMHSFYFYADRSFKVDRSVVGRGGATTESGKWWTAKKKHGGRLCMQRERADKRCFKIIRAGDDYEFHDGKGLAFTTHSVDPL